jgi:3beta-hydroxy-delta5-steroid dehydrogenase/steroid delta-isomerase
MVNTEMVNTEMVDTEPVDKDTAAFPTTDLGHCLVTGASGYLGSHLVKALLERGCQVRGFDRAAAAWSHERLDRIEGDVRNREELRKACEGVDTVFHAAAVLDFRGFAPRQARERSHSINVLGTRNALEAAAEAGVQRFVYTSTNNVTFDGPVEDGDETWPYVVKPQDLYTETKILAEKAVLEANGRGGMLTCAIRPGGIYGPGEQLFLPTVVEQCAAGRLMAVIGDGSALSDNTYIDNLSDGHIEAARHLLPESALQGQAYFITDGNPINYFEFFRPLVDAMGLRFPTRHIPGAPLYALAAVWEFLHWAIKLPPPLLTRLEVRKITVSHYSSIDKARRDFGWQPPVSVAEATDRAAAYCKEILATRESVERPHWAWWIAILGGLTLLGVLTLSPAAHGWWSANVTSWTPRWLLAPIFVWAVLLHVYKGMKAVRLAEQAGLHQTSLGWGWQTFLLGFASLGLLEKRIARRRANGD